MGIFDFMRNQFIEVIEWTDNTSNTLVYRFPVANNEIKMGASLIVRESQMAVFVNEGVVADVFGPGHHELATRNMSLGVLEQGLSMKEMTTWSICMI